MLRLQGTGEPHAQSGLGRGRGRGAAGLRGTGGSLYPETGRETSGECGKACTLARQTRQAARLEARARAAKSGSAWPGPIVFLRHLSADWCDLRKPGGSGKQIPSVTVVQWGGQHGLIEN